MTATRFQINEVFDIGARAGLLVVGSADEDFTGVPRLHDELTGHPITILGVDFPTPRTLRTGETILVVDRIDAGYATTGRVWTA